MNEEINTLIEESAGGDAVDGDVIRLEALTCRSELVEGVIGGQSDGSDDGYMGLEVGPAELRSKAGHEVGEPLAYIIRWNRPHRIRLTASHRNQNPNMDVSVSVCDCVAFMPASSRMWIWIVASSPPSLSLVIFHVIVTYFIPSLF